MELETENSQCSNGEGEDVEMENTNNAPIEIDSNDEDKKFMWFKKANGNNYLFESGMKTLHSKRA